MQAPDRAALELMANLMEASMKDSQHITNSLLESISKQNEYRMATIILIRDSIHNLLGGTYMPTPQALVRALYPDEREVEAALKEYVALGVIIPLMQEGRSE